MDEQPKLGLALGGGGVRGLAHVGVLKVFQREGVTPYCITGTSMGAIIGALYAAGKSVDEIEDTVTDVISLTSMIKLADLTYPWRGLFAGHNAVEYLRKSLGADLCMEDCRIKLGVSAVDLIARKLLYITSGNVVDAVRASMSLVGVFAPLQQGKRRLADGGYLDNVPAGLARELGADIVIAVDVGTEFAYTDGDDHGNPVNARLPAVTPPVIQDLLQLNMMMVQELAQLRLQLARPEVVLRPCIPPTVGILTGFEHIPDVYAAGIAAAEAALPRIRELLQGMPAQTEPAGSPEQAKMP